MLRFATTTFLSAFLLFQVQPLMGRYILPWFGGGPAIWMTCMLFFQALLLAGYALTHVLASRLSPRAHGWVHAALLAAALAFLPITPAAAVWKPTSSDAPAANILLLLLANVGFPYLLLSMTAPLLQRWFSLSFPGRSPYRLYALSNAGSLLALLTYPALFEPHFKLNVQVLAWSISFAAFAILCGWCAVRVAWAERAPDPPAVTLPPAPDEALGSLDCPAPSPAVSRTRPTLGAVLLWLLFAAAGSAFLLATTNQLCQEVVAFPFLWVLPLALYLATFIICFDGERWYDRRVFGPFFILTIPLACHALSEGVSMDMWKQIVFFSATLFACCMSCHGELVRLKPEPRHLTLFYLIVSAGGALGGAFVALVAPAAFPDYWEYHIALAAACALLLLSWFRDRARLRFSITLAGIREDARPWSVRIPGRGLVLASLAIGFAILILRLAPDLSGDEEGILERTRNFYGVLRVTEYEGDRGTMRSLRHGRILHGNQCIDPEHSREATTYYGPESGIGLAFAFHPRRAADDPLERGLKAGAVGLGTGTIAALGQAGDTIRFYEINPAVVRLSDTYFTYRAESKARIEIVMGDARISLERQLAAGAAQEYDIIAVDAFTSDAIPVHLLTAECAEIYREHLKPDGILLLHISNRFLNLNPIVRALGDHLGLEAVLIDSDDDDERGIDAAAWAILTGNRAFLESPDVIAARDEWPEDDPPPLLWTDDFAGLWQVFEFD